MKVLSTEDFWEHQGHVAFVRLSLNWGAIGNEVYYVDEPPGPEYVERAIADIMRNLQLDKPHPIADFMLSISIPLMWLVLATFGAFLWWLWT